MELAYLFEHNNKVVKPLPVVKEFIGLCPSQDNIILFGGEEANALKKADLPNAVWRVRQLAFDISDGAVIRITLALELRNKKAERELA